MRLEIFNRFRTWARQIYATELPCGCLATDRRSGRFSNQTTVIDRDHRTIRSIAYTNCTKEENEWMLTVECDHCGATWQTRRKAGPTIKYGEKNPDADMKLITRHHVIGVRHEEVPVADLEGL